MLRELKQKLGRESSLQSKLDVLCDSIGAYLPCDQVQIICEHNGLEFRAHYSSLQRRASAREAPLVSIKEGKLYIDSLLQELPLFVGDREKRRIPPQILSVLRSHEIQSLAIIPIIAKDRCCGAIEISFFNIFHRWTMEERFTLEQASQYLAFNIESIKDFANNGHNTVEISLGQTVKDKTVQSRMHERYERLAKYGELVIIRSDASFKMEDITGEAKEILGFEPHELLGDERAWRRFLHPDDFRRIQRLMAKLRHAPREMSEEVRVIDRMGTVKRWLLLKGVPLFKQGELIGWEGFGLDISERHRAQEQAIQQSRRIEALYEVARATQFHSEPAVVLLKGLRALIKATDSDCGFACLYDQITGSIEIVAVEGLSQRYVDEVQGHINDAPILREVITTRKGLIFDNIQEEPRALLDLVKRENLKSTIVAPLVLDDAALGAIVIYCKNRARYRDGDFELVSAAASQICVSMRQAESFYAEKQHADSLAILYRISHELSKYVNAKEVAERAFPLIQKEIVCRRIWLGIINEQGTHLVGQAGFGPGVRKRLINMQVELYLRHDFLDEAIKTKRAVMVPANQQMECSGLNNIIRRLEIGALVIVPLVALAQVVGVLVVEPVSPALHLIERKIPLLTSMSNEIATVLLARRFEAKMADADKMRMAGMLASGVAHNFNNLLQAVMGQASLLEMQLPKESPMNKSARMIVDAAGKGASLINQLLSFSAGDSNKRRNILFDNLLNESRDLYKSILGSDIKLEVNCRPNLPQVFADYGQIQQVMTNLLVNAKEALAGKSDGTIRIIAGEVRLKSGEVDPELAPGHYVQVDVEDNGIGMDAERQARCFEPFFTSKNVDSRTGLGFSGSGLGLSSAYSIMKQHEGLIIVRSSEGEGSVFSLFFPVVSSKHVEMNHDMLYAGVAGDSLDVMIYDMDEGVTTSVRPILESAGLRSVATNKEERALELLRRPRSSVRAVIIDVDKTGYDILQFLRSLRAEFQELLILIYTRDPRRWSRLLQDMPRVDLIEKPIGVWGIHSLARRITSYKKVVGLGSKLETEHGPEVSAELNQENGPSNLAVEPAISKEESREQSEV